MPVLCTFISVIIRRDSIEKYFQGGWQRFVLELPNYSMCTDGELVNVGFMNPNDALSYIKFLKSEGLQYENSSNDQSKTRAIDDVDVLDRFNGHRVKRDWIEFGDKTFNDQKSFCCWLKGTAKKTLAIPTTYNKGKVVFTIPLFVSPDKFAERFSFLRTENDLDIYLDSKKKGEFYLPQGMDFEDYNAQSNEKMKQDQLKVLAQKLDKQAEKEEEKRIADEEIPWEEKVKKTEKKRQAERIVRANKAAIETEKKRQAEQKKIEKKAEDKLYTKVAKTLKKKTVGRSNPTGVMEELIEHALKTNDDKDIELIEEFWCENYGLFGFLDDGDNFYVSVDPHDIVAQMKFQWEGYVGSDESEKSEMSDEDKFNIFKNMINGRFEENGCRSVKKIGKYFISTYLSDPRENYSDLNIHSSSKELEDLYKSDGYFYFDGGGEGNCNDQSMREFFDEHYLKPNHLDNLLRALINDEGVEAATEEFNQTIREFIADDKKPMMYSISIDEVINWFEEGLSEQTSDKGFEYHKAALQMNLGDFYWGHVVLRHYNYVMTAEWNLWEECSSFRLFYSDWEMNKYYKGKGLVLFSLDKQYPPLNFTDEEIRELYDKCAKKLL